VGGSTPAAVAAEHFAPPPGLTAREKALWGSGDDDAAREAQAARQALEAEMPDWGLGVEG